MEVILLERVENLGYVGDKVRVKDGYARNYLFPRKKALRATTQNIAVFEEKKAHIEQENAAKRAEAETKAKSIESTFITLIEQAGDDGRLFGSVRRQDVAAALAEVTETEILDRSAIALKAPIKEIGAFNIAVYLHPEVKATIHAIVARSQDEAEEAKRDFLNTSKKKASAKKEAVAEEASTEAQEAN